MNKQQHDRKLRDLLITAAKGAGEIQRTILAQGSFDLPTKYGGTSSSDIVTVADLESEKYLRKFFHKHLPDFNIFGEEFGATYNGNGKVLLIDPLDGTKSFKEHLPRFGPVIGVYVNRRNIAGVEYNVLKDRMYLGTHTTGFELLGDEMFELYGYSREVPAEAIYIGGSLREVPGFHDHLAELVDKEFPHNPIIINKQDVHNRTRAMHVWSVFFHAGLARHDIAAAPLFAELTNTKLTDHRGKSYDVLDPLVELAKYTDGRKAIVYSNPVLVTQPGYFEGMLRVLNNFKEALDRKQNPFHT